MRDGIYEKTLEQHNLKYDHGLLRAYDPNEKRLRVDSVEVESGFFDANGNDLADYHEGEILPDGDANSNLYWQALKQKTYWYDHNQSSVSNMPSNYGFVVINKIASDVYIHFHAQSSGPIYVKSCNASIITNWREMYDESNFKDDYPTKHYWAPGDLGYSGATSLVTICSAMSDKSIFIGHHSDFQSSDMPTGDLYIVEILKHSANRCRIIASRASNYTYSTNYAFMQNWRAYEGRLTGWKVLV